MTLRAGMVVRMPTGERADVVRVTDCSAVVRLPGQVREFRPMGQEEPVRIASAGRLVTISPRSEVEAWTAPTAPTLIEAPAELAGCAVLTLEVQTLADVAAERARAERRELMAERQARRLVGRSVDTTGDMLDPLAGGLFGYRRART